MIISKIAHHPMHHRITLNCPTLFRLNLCARPPLVALRNLVAHIPHRTFLCASVQSEEIRSHLNLSLSCLKIDSQCVFIHLPPQTPWSRRGERGHVVAYGHTGTKEATGIFITSQTEKMRHVPLTSVCSLYSEGTNCVHVYIYDQFCLYNSIILRPKLLVTSLIGI